MVLISPRCDFLPGIDPVPKQFSIQTFIPEPTIEALHMTVPHGPPRLDVDQPDLPLFASAQNSRASCTFRPASCCFNTPMICSGVNRPFFISGSSFVVVFTTPTPKILEFNW